MCGIIEEGVDLRAHPQPAGQSSRQMAQVIFRRACNVESARLADLYEQMQPTSMPSPPLAGHCRHCRSKPENTLLTGRISLPHCDEMKGVASECPHPKVAALSSSSDRPLSALPFPKRGTLDRKAARYLPQNFCQVQARFWNISGYGHELIGSILQDPGE